MKLNEGEGRLGNGAVMMILIAEDADAGRDFHLGVVGMVMYCKRKTSAEREDRP